MSRWTVKLHQSHRNGAKNPKQRWVVDPPGYDHKLRAELTGNWHRAGGKWFQWGGDVSKREAWREAMDYADRMARTREVVLPRPNFEDEVAERTALGPVKYRKVKGWSFPEHQVSLVYEPESDVALYYLVDDTTKQQRALALRREEWADVATALLALAEQEEHE